MMMLIIKEPFQYIIIIMIISIKFYVLGMTLNCLVAYLRTNSVG